MLTETQARRIKPGDKPVADGTVTGLRLIPTASKGRGKWQLRFVSPESERRRDMGLGVYPDVAIATARERALEARKLIAVGVDPIAENKRQKEQAEPPPVCRRLQSKYGWSLWKKVTEQTGFRPRSAPARFG